MAHRIYLVLFALLLTLPSCGRSGSPAKEEVAEQNEAKEEAPAPKLFLTLMADPSKTVAGDRVRFSVKVRSNSDEDLNLLVPAAGQRLGVYTLELTDGEGKSLESGVVRSTFRKWRERPLQASQVFDTLQPRYTSILSLSRLLDRSQEIAFTKAGTYKARLVYDTTGTDEIRVSFDTSLAAKCETPGDFHRRFDTIHRGRFVSQDLTIEVLPSEEGEDATGLHLTLRDVQDQRKVGDDLELRCEIENRTARPLTLLSSEAGGTLDVVRLLLTDEEGQPLEPGILVLGGEDRSMEEVSTERIFMHLDPGQRAEFDPMRQIHRVLAYSFSKAGRYHVRLAYESRDLKSLKKSFQERLAGAAEDSESVAKALGSLHLGGAASNTLVLDVSAE
ncbi:MAG: hypothetical protein ACYTFG_01010 [Planctomycetota bacterium]|jgi:hypothetical protein